jgi:hypothetical protein
MSSTTPDACPVRILPNVRTRALVCRTDVTRAADRNGGSAFDPYSGAIVHRMAFLPAVPGSHVCDACVREFGAAKVTPEHAILHQL